jgi:hypothetical protein
MNGILIENNKFKYSESADLSLGSHQNNVLIRNNGKITTAIHENGKKAVSLDY